MLVWREGGTDFGGDCHTVSVSNENAIGGWRLSLADDGLEDANVLRITDTI